MENGALTREGCQGENELRETLWWKRPFDHADSEYRIHFCGAALSEPLFMPPFSAVFVHYFAQKRRVIARASSFRRRGLVSTAAWSSGSRRELLCREALVRLRPAAKHFAALLTNC